MTAIFYVISGLLLLFIGGESLLRGSISLAKTFNVSRLLIGVVIIGFGTSMPELTVSVGAALKNSPDIALGNVIGSNIANILLIIGISAIINPLHIRNKNIRRDIYAMFFSAGMLAVLMWFDVLNFLAGLAFLVTLVVYIMWSIVVDRREQNRFQEHMEEDSGLQKSYNTSVAFFMSIMGLAFLVGGAILLVDGAVSLARGFGVPEAVIGLTLVAVGTSLPELATSIVASIKKHSDVVFGNILGSNVFNILGILGIATIIKPIPVSAQMLNTDIWVMLAVSLFLGMLLLWRISINRRIGALMLLAYIGYSAFLYTQV